MLIVKKFGGTSVANKERIFNVAKRCIEDYKKGNQVVVVLSAMGKYTDEDLLTFSLEEREKLPDKIKYLFDHEEYRKIIAQNGKQKTLLLHTWDKRAEQFLDILDKRLRTDF